MAATPGLIDVHDALRQAGLLNAATSHRAQVATEQLSGGLTNDNILITFTDGQKTTKLVLRRFKRETSRHLRYNRAHELKNATIAADSGIGPAVVASLSASSEHGGGLLIAYIEGTTLDERRIRQLVHAGETPAASLLAQTVHRLHACRPFVNAFDPFAARQAYEDESAKLAASSCAGPPMWTGFEDVIRKVAPLRAKLESLNEPLVPCHNDLLAANLIAEKDSDTSLMIIDYELSGMAPASWELGNIISENSLDDDEGAMRALVVGYWELRAQAAGSLDRSEDNSWLEGRIARAKAWSIVSKLTWAAWGRVLHLLAAAEATSSKAAASAEHAFDYEHWSLTRMAKAKTALADVRGLSTIIDALQRDALDDSLQ